MSRPCKSNPVGAESLERPTMSDKLTWIAVLAKKFRTTHTPANPSVLMIHHNGYETVIHKRSGLKDCYIFHCAQTGSVLYELSLKDVIKTIYEQGENEVPF